MFRLISSLRIAMKAFKNAWSLIGAGVIKPGDKVVIKFDWYCNVK